MFLRKAPALLAVLSIAACAQQPDKVTPTYVSPATYASYSCKQLVTERNAIVQNVNNLNTAQKRKADNDGAAVAVGAVLFWPALFFLGKRNDMAPQLAAMKGSYDAITAAGVSKRCFPAPPATPAAVPAATPPT